MNLVPIKFQDDSYNGGAISAGWLDTDTQTIIEPGNTNGNQVDPYGWMLAQYQAGKAVLNATLAGKIRGDCAATGITPPSFWEYIGKPITVMAASIAGGELLGAAGGTAAGGTAAAGSGSAALAPTVIAAPAAPTLATGISTAGLTGIGTGTVASVGAATATGVSAAGAGASLLSGAQALGETVATKVLGTVATGLLVKKLSPGAPIVGLKLPQRPVDQVAPTKATSGSSLYIWIALGAAALGAVAFL